MSKFDHFIEETGQFGRYQKMLLVMVMLVVIPAGFNTSIPIFLLTIPHHRCALDNYPNDTYATQSAFHASLINSSIPLDNKGKREQCLILRPDHRHKLIKRELPATGHDDVINGSTIAPDDGLAAVQCDRWVYDHEFFERSVIEELEIICERKQWRTHANMAMMVGKLASAFVQGICSDLFGRRKTLLAFIFVVIASTFANAFIYNIPSLIAFRFLAGLSTTSTYLNCFVLVMEFVGPRYRKMFGISTGMAWVIGGFILAGIAYALRDFTHLCLALASPTVLLLSYFWLIPESPRWLITKGRTQEARVILEKMAKVNGVTFPESLFGEMVEEIEKSEREKKEAKESGRKSTETLITMLNHKRLALRFAFVLWNWISNSLIFYGILLNVQNLSGSVYLNYTITCCVDMIGLFAASFLVDRYGRKKVYDLFLGLATFSCISAIFPSIYAEGRDADVIMIVLSMTGRLGISTSFNILFLLSAEMFPTTVRNSAMGISSMTSRVGSIGAPYIADLGLQIGGDLASALPLMVFGGAGLMALTLSFFLPETGGRKLPDTIQDEVEQSRQDYLNKKKQKHTTQTSKDDINLDSITKKS